MNKKSFNVLISFLVLLSILFTVPVNASKVIKDVDIFIGNSRVNFTKDSGQAYIDNKGRTLVPLRLISQELGHEVKWNSSDNSVKIDSNIVIKIGEDNFKMLNPSKTIKMDTQAILINGRTYVPVRFIAEALGHKVDYKKVGKIHKISIYKNEGNANNITEANKKEEFQAEILDINHNKKEITLQKVEMVWDEGRLDELGLNIDYYSLPNGYYVHQIGEPRKYKITNCSKFSLFKDSIEPIPVNFDTYYSSYNNLNKLCVPPINTISTNNGKIISIEAFYTP